MFCPNCGLQLPEGTNFCPRCGTPLHSVRPPANPQQQAPHLSKITQEPQSPRPAKKSSFWRIILAIILSVLFLFVFTLIMIAIGGRNSAKRTPTRIPTIAPTATEVPTPVPTDTPAEESQILLPAAPTSTAQVMEVCRNMLLIWNFNAGTLGLDLPEIILDDYKADEPRACTYTINTGSVSGRVYAYLDQYDGPDGAVISLPVHTDADRAAIIGYAASVAAHIDMIAPATAQRYITEAVASGSTTVKLDRYNARIDSYTDPWQIWIDK